MRKNQVQAFLSTQWPHVAELARLHGVTKVSYDASAATLAGTVNEGPEPAPRESVLGLRNPLDGALAAERLACGEMPNLHRLMEQQVQRAGDEYAKTRGREFPWEGFADAILPWVLDDAATLKLSSFAAEAATLNELQLLRRLPDDSWRFRHERIRDQFVVHAFLGKNAQRQYTLASERRVLAIYRILPEKLYNKQTQVPRDSVDTVYEWLAAQSAASDAFLPAFRYFYLGMADIGLHPQEVHAHGSPSDATAG
ncbi:MAG: hypothetical protein H0V54_03090 [Chthoniobacterales bacterium]|nr:hypothetical protein [Chthoniobacterales bacterium]